jgi:hypothetical protein
MTSDEIISLLETKWPKCLFAHVREFRPSTGYKGDERRIDLWVINRAPSAGMPAHSVEIKISRSDWLRELKSPTKSRLALAVSNYMWLACPSGVAKPEELPPMWGLIEVDPLAEWNYEKIKTIHPAEYRDKVRPTWGMIASLIRGMEREEKK